MPARREALESPVVWLKRSARSSRRKSHSTRAPIHFSHHYPRSVPSAVHPASQLSRFGAWPDSHLQTCTAPFLHSVASSTWPGLCPYNDIHHNAGGRSASHAHPRSVLAWSRWRWPVARLPRSPRCGSGSCRRLPYPFRHASARRTSALRLPCSGRPAGWQFATISINRRSATGGPTASPSWL
jgi:hypothetical protein